MEHDKQHSIPPNVVVNIENHYHNHIDTADILSQLHILKMQHKQILTLLLSSEDDERERAEIMRKLNKAIADIKSTI